MKYIKLGSTGIDVSRICLGCMSYGSSTRGSHDWALEEAESRPFIQQALDAGINFFDTANVYSLGASEEVLGRAIKDMANRDEVVIATKVAGQMKPGPNGGGLSRKAIMSELDNSLRRLDMDYVDLYQIHRWDPATPIEETLEALHDVVKSGKVRYIGASSMWAWQFTKALMLADQNGWTRFATMQNHYNLLNREEEREMMPVCEDQGIGVIPWSPMARGMLTRTWGERTNRTETDAFGIEQMELCDGIDQRQSEPMRDIIVSSHRFRNDAADHFPATTLHNKEVCSSDRWVVAEQIGTRRLVEDFPQHR